MFRGKTVFIIGAGASRHYGYPTGEELVRCVDKKASSAHYYFRDASRDHEAFQVRPDFVKRKQPILPSDSNLIPALRQQMVEAASECLDLSERLQAVDPLVIDYFIGQNRHLEEITKLCIAWELLEREATASYGENDNWCRFIIHRLVSGCRDGSALLDNNVNFVMFNYDISLERQLWRGLSALRQFDDVASEFLFADDRIIHLYGRIRENAKERPSRSV
jgi:hypothetical protein